MPLPTRRSVAAVLFGLPAALASAGVSAGAWAQTPAFTLTMRNQTFEPAELEVPAGQKFELRIVNEEAVNVEFESTDLRREKVITRGQSATLYLGPLRPGRYEVFDDFRRHVRGAIVAR